MELHALLTQVACSVLLSHTVGALTIQSSLQTANFIIPRRKSKDPHNVTQHNGQEKWTNQSA